MTTIDQAIYVGVWLFIVASAQQLIYFIATCRQIDRAHEEVQLVGKRLKAIEKALGMPLKREDIEVPQFIKDHKVER